MVTLYLLKSDQIVMGIVLWGSRCYPSWRFVKCWCIQAGDLSNVGTPAILDMVLSKTPIAPCYCQMMDQTLKEEIRITQYNNPRKAGNTHWKTFSGLLTIF